MSPSNPKDQSVLVNKLILVVLVGILGCLVVLIVRQNNFLADQEQLAKNRGIPDQQATLGEPAIDQPSLVANRPPAASLRRATARTQRTAPAPTAISINDEAPLEAVHLESNPQFPTRLVESVVVSSRPVLRGGEIAGTVTLRGTPPPEIPIQMNSICGRLHTNVVTTRHFVVSRDGGLANVFVYVKSGVRPARYTPPPPDVTPLLDQRGCL